MKKATPSLRLAFLTAAFVILHSSLVTAQSGALTPPGAPAPTIKTLDQLEARTPIATAPFTISADQVTLDLNGFTISSTHATGNGTGVLISGLRRNVVVCNGHIRGNTTFAAGTFTAGGFSDGISGNNSGNLNVRISEVSVHGVALEGIDLFSINSRTLVVERCAITVTGSSGIRAGLARDCVVETAGLTGILVNMALSCSGETVSTSGGSAGISSTVIENCRGIAIAGTGVSGSVVTNSSGTSSSGIGLDAGATAHNCQGISTSGIGLEENCATNCDGTSTSGSFGVRVLGTASFCRGKRDGGVAISAPIAIGCTANGTGTITSANKFLGTP